MRPEDVVLIGAICFTAGWIVCQTVIYYFRNKGTLYINLTDAEQELANLNLSANLEEVMKHDIVVFKVRVR